MIYSIDCGLWTVVSVTYQLSIVNKVQELRPDSSKLNPVSTLDSSSLDVSALMSQLTIVISHKPCPEKLWLKLQILAFVFSDVF